MKLDERTVAGSLVYRLDRESHCVAVYDPGGRSYHVVKTYNIKSFGPLIKKQLLNPLEIDSSHPMQLIKQGQQGDSVVFEFHIDKNALSFITDQDYLEKSQEVFGFLYGHSQNAFAENRLYIEFADTDLFFNPVKEKYFFIPSPYLSFSERSNYLSLQRELPASRLLSIAPEIMQNYEDFCRDQFSVYNYQAFFNYMNAFFLNEDLAVELSDKAGLVYEQHKDFIEVCGHLVPPELRKTMETALSFNPDDRFQYFQDLKNELIKFSFAKRWKQEEPQLQSSLTQVVVLGKAKDSLNNSIDKITKAKIANKGIAVLMSGPKANGKRTILQEVKRAVIDCKTEYLFLSQEARCLNENFNPLFELNYALLAKVEKLLKKDNRKKAQFLEEFSEQIPYLVSLRESLKTVFQNLNFPESYIGVGQITDLELIQLSKKLLKFYISKDKYLIVEVAGNFRVGLNRARSNSIDLLALTEQFPLALIGSYSDGSSESYLNYRMSEFGKNYVTEIAVPFVNQKDIEEFLSYLSLSQTDQLAEVAEQLFSLTEGRLATLRSVIMYSVQNKYVYLDDKKSAVWELEPLKSKQEKLTAGYRQGSILQGISNGEKVILKRCSLVDTPLPAEYLLSGLESTGHAGLQRLVSLGALVKSESENAGLRLYGLSNTNLRAYILGEMEKREKTFLSIQLARVISSSSVDGIQNVEANLWAKVVDYLSSKNDKRKAIDAFIERAKLSLKVSDYEGGQLYLDLANTLFDSSADEFYSEGKSSFYRLMAICLFRNRKERMAIRFFDLAIDLCKSAVDRAQVRKGLIECYILVGKHKEAIVVAEDNYKDLNFSPKAFVGVIDVIRFLVMAFFGFVSNTSSAKAAKLTKNDEIRFSAIMETFLAVGPAYYSTSKKDFNRLQIAIYELSKLLPGTRYAPFRYINLALASVIFFNNRENARKFFREGKDLARKLGEPFATSRCKSLETMVVDSAYMNRSELNEKLSQVANLSLSANDEIVYVYTELTQLMQQFLAGNTSLEGILEKIRADKYQSKKTNRKEALSSYELWEYQLRSQLTPVEAKPIYKDKANFLKSVEKKDGNLRAYSHFMVSGVFKFLEGDYEAAKQLFGEANDDGVENFGLPNLMDREFFFAMSELRSSQKSNFFTKLNVFLKNGLRYFALRKQYNISNDLWLPKKLILKSEFLSYFFPKIGIERLQRSMFKYGPSWSHLERLIASTSLATHYQSIGDSLLASKSLDTLFQSLDALSYEKLSEQYIARFSEGEQDLIPSEVFHEDELSDKWKSILDLVNGQGKESGQSRVDRLLDFLVQYSGAERCIVLLHDDNFWKVRALNDGGGKFTELKDVDSSELNELCSQQMIEYTFELGKSLRVDDAVNDDTHLDDNYIQTYEVRSIFCMPIYRLGEEVGILYLENNSMASCFKNIKSEVPNLIVGLLISALDDLEQKQMLLKEVENKQGELQKTKEEMSIYSQKADTAKVASDTLASLVSVLQSLSFEMEKFESCHLRSYQAVQEKLSVLEKFSPLLENIELAQDQEPYAELLQKLQDRVKKDSMNLDHLTDIFSSKLQILKASIDSQQNISLENTQQEKGELIEILSLAKNILKPSLEELNVQFDIKINPGVVLPGGKAVWVQAFVNLFKNSIEAIQVAKPNKARIYVSASIHSEVKLEIRVRDNGVGIDSDTLPKLVEYGFSTKKNGHGFGLHSVANLIESLEGRLEIRSNGKGRGCEVLVALPLKKA